jgi:hypothetical protein
MTPAIKTPLAIAQTPSFIAGKTFIEQIPYHYVEQLMQNDCLKDKWDLANYSQVVASQCYMNEKEQLTAYLVNYNKKLNGFAVKYIKAKHKWGRVFPSKSLGLTSFAKKTRNTFIKDTYYDFDLKNAQPEILRCICQANDIPCDTITKYCNEREEIMEDIIKASGNKCSRDVVKNLIISLSFYGSFDGWLKEHNIEPFPEPIIVKQYMDEVRSIATIIKKANPEMYKTMERVKKSKGGKNFMGSFLSTYLQEYELRIVENVLLWLCQSTDICKTDLLNFLLAIYEYDGLKLVKRNVDKHGVDELLRQMNEATKAFGFDIKWELKPITKFYDIEFTEPIIPKTLKEQKAEIKEQAQQEEARLEAEAYEADLLNAKIKKALYAAMKTNFEKTHCKIITTGLFVENRGDKYLMRTKKQLYDAYEHVTYQTDEVKGHSYFIHEWLKDPTIRVYYDIGVFPNATKCPTNVLNMWLPFAMEKEVGEYEQDIEGRDFILNHLKILCDHDVTIHAYFEMWIAQMIQHPEYKSTCPVLIGEQGGGKGTFMELMKKQLGDEKVLITAQPDKHVWGNFNNLMANAYLVAFDEMSKSVSNSAVEFIKNLITDAKITINDKGHSAYTINSYHHFIMMTNKADGGITTEQGDRRKLMIRISDEKKGDLEYFNKFYAYLENKNTMRTVYDYFKNMKDVPTMLPPPPATEYQDNLKLLSEDILIRWLKDYVRDCINKGDAIFNNTVEEDDDDSGLESITPSLFYKEDNAICRKFMSAEIFENFKAWRDANQEHFETTPLKFGVNLANKKLKGITKGPHTKKGETKIFNITELAKHFCIGCLIEPVQNKQLKCSNELKELAAKITEVTSEMNDAIQNIKRSLVDPSETDETKHGIAFLDAAKSSTVLQLKSKIQLLEDRQKVVQSNMLCVA